MLPKKLALVFAAVAVLAATACSVKNVEMDGAYEGAGIRETAHPVMTEMFNLAFKAAELPAASVSSGDYVAVYRLSSGKAEDRWWCYLAEDWLVDKVRAAGATPVERNALAARLREAEGAYVEPPAASLAGGTSPSLAKLRVNETPLTSYRATRALAYRVVAADLWFDQFQGHHHGGEATVRANAQVTVNLRTLDVRTGEVLWAGSVTGTAKKAFPISRLIGWPGIYDWEDDWAGPWWWRWHWDDGTPAVAEPAEDVPAEKSEDEAPAAAEPADADLTSSSAP